jgi:hypothetical protein
MTVFATAFFIWPFMFTAFDKLFASTHLYQLGNELKWTFGNSTLNLRSAYRFFTDEPRSNSTEVTLSGMTIKISRYFDSVTEKNI